MSELLLRDLNLNCNLVMVSGGFDPLHPGHVEYFLAAKNSARRAFYPRLLVAVDSDEYVATKHPVMIPAQERAKMLKALRMVDRVEVSQKMDVCDILRSHKPRHYCVGPDHADLSFPEKEVCAELGIELTVLDYRREWSSTELISRVQWSSKNLPVTVSLLGKVGDGILIGLAKEGWCLPGGFVEPGESLEEAVYREWQEETGTPSPSPLSYWGSVKGTYHDGRAVLAVYFLGDYLGEPQARGELRGFTTVDAPRDLSTDCDTWALRSFFQER